MIKRLKSWLSLKNKQLTPFNKESVETHFKRLEEDLDVVISLDTLDLLAKKGNLYWLNCISCCIVGSSGRTSNGFSSFAWRHYETVLRFQNRFDHEAFPFQLCGCHASYSAIAPRLVLPVHARADQVSHDDRDRDVAALTCRSNVNNNSRPA